MSLLDILVSCQLIVLSEALRVLCLSWLPKGLLLEGLFELWPRWE